MPLAVFRRTFLFPIVPVHFPVPILVPFPFSVNKPLFTLSFDGTGMGTLAQRILCGSFHNAAGLGKAKESMVMNSFSTHLKHVMNSFSTHLKHGFITARVRGGGGGGVRSVQPGGGGGSGPAGGGGVRSVQPGGGVRSSWWGGGVRSVQPGGGVRSSWGVGGCVRSSWEGGGGSAKI